MSEEGALTGQVAEPLPLRLFIALTPSEAVRGTLAEVQDRLRQRLPKGAVKWTPPRQIHLTLRFLGDVAAESVSGLSAALANVVATQLGFALEAHGLDVFPNPRRPRVVWVGLGGGLRELAHLQAAVEAATAPWGAREAKAFHAHLTLGRIRDLPAARLREIGEALATFNVGQLGRWAVSEVKLYRSELRPEGSIHTCLASVGMGRKS